MKRPLTRPAKPMTQKEFLNAAYQHFAVDKSPCSFNELGSCKYGGTGCWIGFVLTKEDAASIEHASFRTMRIWDGKYDGNYHFKDMASIANAYFQVDENLLQVLKNGQEFHDARKLRHPDEFTEEMTEFIVGLQNQLKD